ncbi:MAG TPA: S-methyl-5-thioribose-1-phosphate isomerase [Casimicrobiaceae bacterium]|nr:S-methyl-5-thioribose-1-phosphate isomerase [Casimicrobiaceae bacterium]
MQERNETGFDHASPPLPVKGVPGVREAYRALTHLPGARFIDVLDQRRLPHETVTLRISDARAAADSIRNMTVRGAPLIGAVAAFGMALALDADASDSALADAHAMLERTRPTAVNLRWALDRVKARVASLAMNARADAAWHEADAISAEDIAINAAIGAHGLSMLRELVARVERPLNVMTHCNAGALATCGFGTATAPLFLAHAEGLPLHVWVSETRPRMQGASLTAWEFAQHGIAHTLFVDSASGLLMRRGDVDLVIVGADRVAANGDVCNKIGTYDKALAARDNDVPFCVALPFPTIDWQLHSGDAIPIESRDDDEVLRIPGRDDAGLSSRVSIATAGTRAVNLAFDVTPARLVTRYLTERGVATSAEALRELYGNERRGG